MSRDILVEAAEVPFLGSGGFEAGWSSWVHKAWQGGPLLPEGGVPWPGSGARLWLAWDEEGLLFAIEAADTTPCQGQRASGAYEWDSVEVFLAPDWEERACVQIVISPGHGPQSGKPSCYYYNQLGERCGGKLHCDWQVESFSGGYRVQARWRWQSAGLMAAEGTLVGARAHVNDRRADGRLLRFVWGRERNGFLPVRLSRSAGAPRQWAAWRFLDEETCLPAVGILGPPEGAGLKAKIGTSQLPLEPMALGCGAWKVCPTDAEEPVVSPAGEEVPALDFRNFMLGELWQDAMNPWRTPTWRLKRAEFLRFELPVHVFADGVVPVPGFRDPQKVRRLLGCEPEWRCLWFDARGNIVSEPCRTGLGGCLAVLVGPHGERTLRRFLVYGLPEGCGPVREHDETAAAVLGLGLSGADATPTHAARAADFWWQEALERALATGAWEDFIPRGLVEYPCAVRSFGHSGDRPRPLLLFLHGTGFAGEGAAERFFEMFARSFPDFVGLVAYPRSPVRWRPAAVHSLLQHLVAAHAVDVRRVGIMGFSMGGIGAWEVLLARPERFACGVIIGGRTGAPADAWRLADVPLLVVNGEDDPTTTVEEAMLMVDAVCQAGGKKVQTLWLEDCAHADSLAKALQSPVLHCWLRETLGCGEVVPPAEARLSSLNKGA